MAKPDYYDSLAVDRRADYTTLKRAYRTLAMNYHPDRNQGDSAAEEKFKEASEMIVNLATEASSNSCCSYGAYSQKRTVWTAAGIASTAV